MFLVKGSAPWTQKTGSGGPVPQVKDKVLLN